MIKILGTEHQGIFNIQELKNECSKNKYKSIFIEYHTEDYWNDVEKNPKNYVDNYCYTNVEKENRPWWYSLEQKYEKLLSSIMFTEEEIEELTRLSHSQFGIDFKRTIEIAVKIIKE